MDESTEIAVLGGFGVGKTMYLERYPEPGETVTGGEYREGPGGKASNQAIQIRRLGVAANLITAIGTDSGAALGRDLWLREGVNTDGVVVLDAPTMVGFICVDSKGDNRIAIAPGALAHMTLADLDGLYPVIDRSAALVVSFELNPLVGFAAIRHARKQGITTLCNPAPATEIPDDVLSCIDYLVPNLSEAAQIVDALGADLREPADIARYLLGRGVGTVIITLGANGVYLDDGQGGAFFTSDLGQQSRRHDRCGRQLCRSVYERTGERRTGVRSRELRNASRRYDGGGGRGGSFLALRGKPDGEKWHGQ